MGEHVKSDRGLRVTKIDCIVGKFKQTFSEDLEDELEAHLKEMDNRLN